METIKNFEYLVRQEVIEVVNSIGSKMKKYFTSLYDDEILQLEMVTTDHPINPDIKDQINVYLKAGGELIPIGPFSNAGRFRALNLSFVFALLAKSSESLSLLILDDPVLSLDDQHKARFLDKLIDPILERQQVILATHYENFYKYAEPIFENAVRLELPPRRKYCDKVSFEPGDLLQKVEDSLNLTSCSWREKGINLRRWIERSLCTLSGYCPTPFVIFNNIPDTVEKYGKISDPRIATYARNTIVNTFNNIVIRRIINPIAHDEELTEPEVRDALSELKKCKKDVDKEIKRFKSLYRHKLLDRAISIIPEIKIISFSKLIPDTEVKIVTEAAAASDGIGISLVRFEKVNLSGHSVVIAVSDTLSPISLCNQYLILDNQDKVPENKDLVVVETEERIRYLRRFCLDNDNNIILESTNSTNPSTPISLKTGIYNVRRIIGVMFEKVRYKIKNDENEWETLGSQPDKIFENLIGIKVVGKSMAPIALNDQIVLIRKDEKSNIYNGDLACVDIIDDGAVIKRCYPKEKEWLLLPINPDNIEDPIYVPIDKIQYIYPLVGVLFEYISEEIFEE